MFPKKSPLHDNGLSPVTHASIFDLDYHVDTIPVDSLNQSRSWSGAEIQEQRMLEASSMKPHPPPRDSSSEPVHRRKPKVRSGDRHQRTPADAHLKPAGKTQPGNSLSMSHS